VGFVQGAVCCEAWQHPLFLWGREVALLVELEADHQRAGEATPIWPL
jgi:hypothetical protein